MVWRKGFSASCNSILDMLVTLLSEPAGGDNCSLDVNALIESAMLRHRDPLQDRWVKRQGRHLIWALLVPLLIGCHRLPPPPDDPIGGLGTAAEYEIGPLDSLEIFVWGAPDLDRKSTR